MVATSAPKLDLERSASAGFDPEEIAAARDVLDQAMFKLALIHRAVIVHALLSVAVHQYDNENETFSVSLHADGVLRLHVNPRFAVDLGVDGTMFVLAHEAYHLLYAHLFADPRFRALATWVLACEAVINDRVPRYLGWSAQLMPTRLDRASGKRTPTGVDPRKLHAAYAKACRELGRSPVPYDEFVATDLACAKFLAEVPRLPRFTQFCTSPDAGSGDDGHGHGRGLNPEQTSQIVEGVLDGLMTRARQGDQVARDALLDLGDQVGEDHPLWGNLGLGALRGRTDPTRRVAFWEQFLLRALASVLEPGDSLAYPMRMLGLRDLFLAEGADELPFMPVGHDMQRDVVIFIDTSGSMGQGLIERLARLVGVVAGATIHWVAFDADTYPFTHGEELRGGGGTSFKILETYLAANDLDPDAVLVVTDGHADHISPPQADRWIWLITPRGDTWPRNAGMECVEIDVPVD
jgi:predicted metal-dependent peptidase